MAGGAQGGGGRPAQANPQGMQQYQNMLQNYRQGMAGAPSQMPGANIAAPGGGLSASAVMPQQFNPDLAKYQPQQQMPLMGGVHGGPTNQMPQQQMPLMGGVHGGPTNQMPQQFGMAKPAVMPRPMPMPQVQGNPNAMPLQRPQMQGRPQPQMLRGRR